MINRFWFWPLYGLVLLAFVLAGAEYIASYSAPSWPARELRPIPVDALTVNVATVFAGTPELVPSYNDWAVRDRRRSIVRPANVRFRWEYRPGSELFLVYTDGRDTLTRGFPAFTSRGLTLKITRLLRP